MYFIPFEPVPEVFSIIFERFGKYSKKLVILGYMPWQTLPNHYKVSTYSFSDFFKTNIENFFWFLFADRAQGEQLKFAVGALSTRFSSTYKYVARSNIRRQVPLFDISPIARRLTFVRAPTEKVKRNGSEETVQTDRGNGPGLSRTGHRPQRSQIKKICVRRSSKVRNLQLNSLVLFLMTIGQISKWYCVLKWHYQVPKWRHLSSRGAPLSAKMAPFVNIVTSRSPFKKVPIFLKA